MTTRYASALWEVPSRIQGDLPTWRRKFRCPHCRAIGGVQRVRVVLDPAELTPTSYRVERVEIPYYMRELPHLADGLRLFGYARRTHLRRRSQHSPIHRRTPVLEAVGDRARPARHSPQRVRGKASGLILALDAAQAGEPFVMSCVNLDCRRRYLVDSLPTPEVMRHTRAGKGA